MKSLAEFHLKNNAVMGVYNNRTLPSSYHDAITEYKAVRENALLVDYSHLSIVSVMGDDASGADQPAGFRRCLHHS